MIKVYHDKVPLFGLGAEPKFPDSYELVAYVQTDSLEEAYRDTNHINEAWWTNRTVKCVKESRSTSVGDVLELNGKLFRCEFTGWKELAE